MSVERVLEYTALPSEKQPDIPKTPPPEWPQQGKITFNDVGLKYDKYGSFVLKNLNFTIQPKEKVRFCSTSMDDVFQKFLCRWELLEGLELENRL